MFLFDTGGESKRTGERWTTRFTGYFERMVAALPAGGGPPDPATVTALYEKYDIVPVALREITLEAYDRLLGLELTDLAVEGCITNAPCGGEKARRSPVGREKGMLNA